MFNEQEIYQNHIDQQFRLLLQTIQALFTSTSNSCSSCRPCSGVEQLRWIATNSLRIAWQLRLPLLYDWLSQGGLKFMCRKPSSWASRNKQEWPIDFRKYLVQELPGSFAVERSDYGKDLTTVSSVSGEEEPFLPINPNVIEVIIHSPRIFTEKLLRLLALPNLYNLLSSVTSLRIGGVNPKFPRIKWSL